MSTSASESVELTKHRDALNVVKKENALKIRDFDQRIREQNRKKLLLRQQRENGHIGTPKRKRARNAKGVRVLRAKQPSPRSRPSHPHLRHSPNQQAILKRRRAMKAKEREQMEAKDKENRNSGNTKKYEYG